MVDETIRIDHLTRRPPFRRHLRALFLKNVTLQWKYKTTNLFFILLPACLAASISGWTGIAGIQPYQSARYGYWTQANGIYVWFWGYFINSSNYTNIGNLTTQGYADGFLQYIEQSKIADYDGYIPSEYQYVPYFREAPSANWVDDTTYNAVSSWRNTGPNTNPPFSKTQNVANAAIEFNKLVPLAMELNYIVQTDTHENMIQDHFAIDYYSGLDARYIFTYYMHSCLINSHLNSTANTTVQLEYTYVSFYDRADNGVAYVMMVMYTVPFTFTVIQPLIVYFLVNERATRFLEMMKIMGLKMKAYWFINHLYYSVMSFGAFLILYAVSLPFVGSGNWAIQTSPFVFLLLALCWAPCSSSFAMLWSQFFAKPMPASISLGLFMMLDTTMAAFFLIAGYDSADYVPWWCILVPPHTLTYGFFMIARYIYVREPQHLEMNHWTTAFTTQMKYVYIILLTQAVIMILLTHYFHNVWPSPYGIQRPWNYLFTSKKKIQYNAVIDSDLYVEEGEGADCKMERQRATNVKRPLPVRLVFLKKEYEHLYKDSDDTGFFKVALASFCLALDNGECVGLLGPNGAGKSTVMNILTGLITPTSGYAVIHGHNIITDMEQIHQLVGFCPQFDVLWDELSVKEHLLFYLRLKGSVPKEFEAQELAHMVQQLRFLDSTQPVAVLSAGEKRRLSIAIAFMGNPKLILLDEPTTGLDLTSRYQIWDLINHQKIGRSILITTHNMQEADALCSRIAIMSRGKLLCIDQPARLKSRFGKGFKLSVMPTGSELDITQFFTTKYPSMQFEAESTTTKSLQFLIPALEEKTQVNMSDVIKDVIALNKEGKIEEWVLKQCSIEEVFLNLIHEDEILE